MKTSRIEQVILPYIAQFQNSDIEVEQVHNMVDDKFVTGNQLAVYNLKQCIDFCTQARAPNIFNHILQVITDNCHSSCLTKFISK